ncbi:MAG: hypothetical protein Q7J14_01035 [Candidatus Magasanikbacteria bacterium]|nr:hypothetical protein [Candidatus Magasanikbacteria bacterium]
MEEIKNRKKLKTDERMNEIVRMFYNSLLLIKKKIEELEKEVKTEEDKEKINKIKSRISKILTT